jgi:hypothetical protein
MAKNRAKSRKSREKPTESAHEQTGGTSGSPPDWLDEVARAYWEYYAAVLRARGQYRDEYRDTLALLAYHLAGCRAAAKRGDEKSFLRHSRHARELAVRFGFTLADAGRLKTLPETTTADEFVFGFEAAERR